MSESFLLCRISPGQRLVYEAERIQNGTVENLSGKIYAVRRGECTYLEKALFAAERNASGLLIINHSDRIDAPASGLGIDPRVTQGMIDRLAGLPIFSMSNTSWAKLAFAVNLGNIAFGSPQRPATVQFVPLKCGVSKTQNSRTTGSITGNGHTERGCETIEENDAKVQQEVTWGHLQVHSKLSPTDLDVPMSHITNDIGNVAKDGPVFQFLTSNFGAPLPSANAPLSLLHAIPADACTELEFGGLSGAEIPVALVVHRGGCPFHVKMAHVERSGAMLAIIVNTKDDPLQRIGGDLPQAGYIGMPAILVTAPTGRYLQQVMQMAYENANIDPNASEFATISLHASADNSITNDWIDLAFYNWEETLAGRRLQ